MHHNPFTYIGGYLHQVNGYDIDYLNLWEIRCWYNVSVEDNYQHMIPLNDDVDIVDFLNVVENYKYEQVHLYVEHMVDNTVMVEEHFFLVARKDGQDGDGGVGGGGVDELPRVACEDGTWEGHDGECEVSQSRKCKSPRVKTRAALSMDKVAHTDLSDIPKASWFRHAFNCHIKCDMLLNNLAESFNTWIKEAKSKLILTMIENSRW